MFNSLLSFTFVVLCAIILLIRGFIMKKKKKDELKEEEKLKDEEHINKLLDNIVNGEKSEESLEEFIEGLNSKIKKKNNNNSIAYIFGFLVHKNIYIHFYVY